MYQRILRKLFRFWLTIKTKQPSTKLTRLGTEGCGWHIPEHYLRPGIIAICAGAGEDVSFDVELNSHGFNVYVLDPTPRARAHIKNLLSAFEKSESFPINNSKNNYDLSNFKPEKFHFDAIGLSGQNGTLKFYAPANPEHVSHSIKNLQNTEEYFEAECVTYDNYLDSKGIDKADIVKLDIEGAEYEVIDSILESNRKPQILAVDFDELNFAINWNVLKRIRRYILKLEQKNYRLIFINHSDFVFEKQAN